MKTKSFHKFLAQNQMCEVFDYEVRSFLIDLPHVNPARLATNSDTLYGAMMLKFENDERLNKNYTQN